jgi:hypothetical protein
MLELNKRRGGLGPPAAGKHAGAHRAPLPPEAEHLERDIAATEAEIDDLTYELYGITDESQTADSSWLPSSQGECRRRGRGIHFSRILEV